MPKPNFFILGAPKCGTTSLAAWLAEHPDVFFSKLKEPAHYNTDYLITNSIVSKDAYLRLFEGAETYEMRAEGSTGYLVSTVAVTKILHDTPEAKFIVCLRNPSHMAHSLHAHRRRCGNEDIADFQRAWNLQELRRNGKRIPLGCQEKKMLDYSHTCSLGEQVQRLLDQVARKHVHFILLEDWKNPRKTWLEVLAFLGVPDDGRDTFPVVNEARRLRLPWLAQLLTAAGNLKQRLGITTGFGIQTRAAALNEFVGKSPRPSPEFDAELTAHFAPDVALLSRLIERDLSHWNAATDLTA